MNDLPGRWLLSRYCIWDIVNASIHLRSIRHATLNHWAEFNQTCYMTSPYGVWQQHFFSLCLMLCSDGVKRSLSVCPSRYLLLKHWWNLTKLSTWPPCGKGVREQHYLSIHLSVHHTTCTCISNISTKHGEFSMHNLVKNENTKIECHLLQFCSVL